MPTNAEVHMFMQEMNHVSKSAGLNLDLLYCSVRCSSEEYEPLWENCSLLST